MRSHPRRRGSFVARQAGVLTLIGLSLSACGASPPANADPVVPAGPLADFARLVGGEWQVRFSNGTLASHAWRWGPGQHSLVRTVRGSADSPWAGDVLYWDPRTRQARQLSMHEDIPGVGRGVGEGTFAFDGDTAVGPCDLMQPRGLRKLCSRWTFTGPDHYRDELLEDTGSGFAPLATWDFTRLPVPVAATTTPSSAASAPTGTLRAFAPLLGHVWQARSGDGASRWTFTWLAPLEVVWVRSESVPTAAAAPTLLREAWVYPPIVAGPPRCLVLSHRGDVHAGEVHELAGGGIRFELRGHEGGRTVQREVHLELDAVGTLRQRVWSITGTDRELVLDRPFRRVGP
jgi:hypothetical protein